MEKREFIDEKKFFEDMQIQIPLSIAVKNNLISEQDIVKPYLDKLKEKIDKIDLNRVAKVYENRFYGFQSEVLQMIDNLLSEGDTDGNKNT